MLTPEFLRRQAENCLRIARACFDLGSAERLRKMASELQAKAAEIEMEHDGPLPRPFPIEAAASSRDGNRR